MKIKKYDASNFKPKPGEIYQGVPNSVYHSLDEFISSGDIKNALVSYEWYLSAKQGNKTRTLPLEMGSALHFIMEDFQTEGFLKRSKDIIASPTKTLGEKWEEIKIKNEDIPVLHIEQIDNVRSMSEKLHELTQKYSMFDKIAMTELSVFFQDPNTGLNCKIRLDVLFASDMIIVDWKSTASRNIWEISGDVGKFGYFISAAFYLKGMSIITGQEYQDFVLAVVRNSEPYLTWLLPIGEMSIQAGREAVRQGLQVIAEKELEADSVIEIPNYQLNKYLGY